VEKSDEKRRRGILVSHESRKVWGASRGVRFYPLLLLPYSASKIEKEPDELDLLRMWLPNLLVSSSDLDHFFGSAFGGSTIGAKPLARPENEKEPELSRLGRNLPSLLSLLLLSCKDLSFPILLSLQLALPEILGRFPSVLFQEDGRSFGCCRSPFLSDPKRPVFENIRELWNRESKEKRLENPLRADDEILFKNPLSGGASGFVGPVTRQTRSPGNTLIRPRRVSY
jgi:hypothetical protein